jgi:ribosomal protein S18 acetylase RimI-like enzyme
LKAAGPNHACKKAIAVLYPALDELSPAALADAADDNLVVHATWAPRQTPGMRVVVEASLVLVDSGLPCDTFNCAFRARLDAVRVRQAIQAALAFFESAGRPFAWWVGPGDQPADLGAYLIAAGLALAESELAMAVDLGVLALPGPTPEGLVIRRVDSQAALADFASIVAAPADRRFYELAAPALLDPNSPQWLYVGYLGDRPVATAEATVAGGVAGLYNIVTDADYRRRGIGTALTLQPLLDARAIGFKTAVLQAAAAGVSIYTRSGFRSFGAIAEYKPPAEL